MEIESIREKCRRSGCHGEQYLAHTRKDITSLGACEVLCWRWLFGNDSTNLSWRSSHHQIGETELTESELDHPRAPAVAAEGMLMHTIVCGGTGVPRNSGHAPH